MIWTTIYDQVTVSHVRKFVIIKLYVGFSKFQQYLFVLYAVMESSRSPSIFFTTSFEIRTQTLSNSSNFHVTEIKQHSVFNRILQKHTSVDLHNNTEDGE